MKTCTRCGEKQLYESFSRRKTRNGEYGYQAYCKRCNREHKQDWIQKNREKVKWNSLWSDYRLRPEDYLSLLERQNNKCAICLSKFTESPRVDHDHSCCPQRGKSCGKCVRGLLCDTCNKMLGAYEYMSKFDTLETYLKAR